MNKLLILKCFLAFLLGAMWVLTVSAEEASAPATPGTNASAGNNAGNNASNNAGTSLTRCSSPRRSPAGPSSSSASPTATAS